MSYARWHTRALIVVSMLSFAAGCDPEVRSNNPFDLDSSPADQARASVVGVVEVPSLTSPEGLNTELRKDNRLQDQQTLDADGAFAFTSLDPGTYVVHLAPVGFVPVSFPVALGPGQDLDVGTIVLEALSGAQGSVLLGEVTLEGETDHQGVLVEVTGRTWQAITNAQGAWAFDATAGTFELRFSRRDFVSVVVPDVVLLAGETRTLASLVLASNPAQIAGVVAGEQPDGTVAPLLDAQVFLRDTGVSGFSAVDGTFNLTGVPPGSHILGVLANGYVPVEVPVLDLAGGEVRTLSADLEMTLARGGLAGTVTLSDSGDASGIVVELTGTGLAAVTGSSGDFAFDRLLAGDYEISARRDGYARKVLGTFTVVTDTTTQAGPHTLARQGGAVSIAEAPYTDSRAITVVLAAIGATGFLASQDPLFADPLLGDTRADPWRPYTPGMTHPFTLADLDGQHEVHVIFFDGSTESTPAVAQTVLDRVAPANPAVTIGSGGAVTIGSGGAFTNASGGIVSLALSALDLPATAGAIVSGLATVEVSNDPAFAGAIPTAYTTNMTWTLDLPAVDGAKSIYARFTDGAGNVSGSVQADVTLDTVGPSAVSVVLSGPDLTRPATTTSALVTATLAATDVNAGAANVNLRVRLANTSGFAGAVYQPFAPGVSWFLTPGDGTKDVYAQVVDAAGNESLVATDSIILDTQGPTAAALTIVEGDGDENGYTSSTSVSLTLDAAGAPMEAEVSESSAFSPVTVVDLSAVTLPTSVPHTLLGIGQRTVWVRYLDAAGNRSDAVSALVEVDTVAPSPVVPTFAPGVLVPSASVDLIPPGAGQASVSITGDLSAPVGIVSAVPGVPVTLSLVAGDGAKNLVVTWHDLAGNTAVLSPITITVDGQGPAAQAFTVTGALADGTPDTGLTATQDVAVDFSAQFDAVSGIMDMQISNLGTLADAVWRPFVAASIPWVLDSANGTRTVYAKFRDTAGNESAVVSGSIDLDTSSPTSPSLVIVEGDGSENGVTASTSIMLRLNAAGTPATALVSEDPSFTTTTSVDLIPLTLPADVAFVLGGVGSRGVWVKYLDAALNLSVTVNATVLVDGTAPAAVLPTLSPGSIVSTPSVDLIPPAAGQTEMEVVGDATAPSGFVSVTPGVPVTVTLTPGDGTKSLTVSWRDDAGNTVTLPALSVLLDGTPPSASAFTVTGGLGDGTSSTLFSASSSVSLDLSAQFDVTSGISEMKISNLADLSDAAWQSFVGSTTVPWLVSSGDGAKTVYARFKDLAGNESIIVSGTITVAATPPSGGSLRIESGSLYTSLQISSVEVAGVGATEMALSIDGFASGATWQAFTTLTTIDLGILDQVSMLVSLRLRNGARVEGGGATATIYYDQTPPVAGSIALSGVLGNASTSSVYSTQPGVVATITAPVGDVVQEMAFAQAATCTTAFGAPFWQPLAATTTVLLTGGDGAKQVCVLFRDAAGNYDVNTATGVSITLDTAPPTNPAFIDLSNGITRLPNVNSDITPVSDAISTATLQCFGGQYGGTWTDCGPSPLTYTLSTNTENTLGVRSRDDAYNVSAASIVSITHDDINPAAPVITDINVEETTLGIAWDPSLSSDVVGYIMNYGFTPGQPVGTGADQGSSPIGVGNLLALALTGLTPGSPYYVSVTAEDAAGNRSDPSGERMLIPQPISTRLVSSFGADFKNVGAGSTRAYVAQNQGVIQLDVNAAASTPQLTGRATVPNLAPSAYSDLPVTSCTHEGVSGDCVFVTGTTIEGDLDALTPPRNTDVYPFGVGIVFFPIGTAADPVVGSLVSSLATPAAQVTLNAGGTQLVTISHLGVRIYDLATPAAPILIASVDYAADSLPSPMVIQDAGVIDVAGVLTLWLVAQDTNAPQRFFRAFSFDVTNPAGTLTGTDHGALLTTGGVEFHNDGAQGNAHVGESGVFVAWESSPSITIGRYDPAAQLTPASSVVVGATGGFKFASAIASSASSVYVFCSFCNTVDPLHGQAFEVDIGGGGALSAGRLVPFENGVNDLIRAGVVANLAGADRLLGVGTSTPTFHTGTRLEQFMRRWELAGASITVASGGPYSDGAGPTFASRDDFVFVATDHTIRTVDVSNALIPRVVATFNDARTSGRYERLQVHGHYLYAAVHHTSSGTAGVDIFRILGSGTLTRVATAGTGNTIDLAVSGRYLYTSQSDGLRAYYVRNPWAPIFFTGPWSPGYQVDVLEARGTVLYAMTRSAGFPRGEFQTLQYVGFVFSTLSAQIQPPGGDQIFVRSLSIEGDLAIASSEDVTYAINIANPALPSFGSLAYDLSGPVVVAGGYLVGMGTQVGVSGEPERGLTYTRWYDGVQVAAERFAACGAERTSDDSSLVHENGRFIASCHRNGNQILVSADRSAGRHLKTYTTPFFAGSHALAVNGNITYHGGPVTGIWDIGYQYHRYDALGVGWPFGSQPVLSTTGADRSMYMLMSDGILLSFLDRDFSPVRPVRIQVWDTTRPTSQPYTELSLYNLPIDRATVESQPVSDGPWAYVARGLAFNTVWDNSRIQVVEINSPGSILYRASHIAPDTTSTYRDLDLYRQHLYAVSEVGLTTEVQVLRVITPYAPVAQTPIPIPGQARIRDIEVSGKYLFYANSNASGDSLGVIDLGTARDGSSAVSLGTFHTSQRPMSALVVTGDTLYVAHNNGIASFDLTPLFEGSGMPTFRATQGSIDGDLGNIYDAELRIHGPWGYVRGEDLRAYDLR